MTARRLILTGTVAVSAALAALAGPASAVCDAYSGNCEDPSPPPVSPPPPDPPIPVGGTELGLLTAVGTGTLAGGTALVIAARRKRPTTPS